MLCEKRLIKVIINSYVTQNANEIINQILYYEYYIDATVK